MVFILALVLPSMAVAKATAFVDRKYVVAYIAGISIVTVYAYWSDKRKAREDLWRTPEHALHSLELLGGWAAAFVSQRLFRHKTAKEEYQFSFWLVAVVHQYVSFDYLNHWRYTTAIHHFIKPLLE